MRGSPFDKLRRANHALCVLQQFAYKFREPISSRSRQLVLYLQVVLADSTNQGDCCGFAVVCKIGAGSAPVVVTTEQATPMNTQAKLGRRMNTPKNGSHATIQPEVDLSILPSIYINQPAFAARLISRACVWMPMSG